MKKHVILMLCAILLFAFGCDGGGSSSGSGSTGDTAAITSDTPASNDPTSSDPATGDPATGDPASGDPVAGDPTTGDPVVPVTYNFNYYAVGFGGRTVASEDGSTWIEVSPGKDDLRDIAFGNNTYIAVGTHGTIYRSTDGDNWQAHAETFGNFTAVAYGDGDFIAVGDKIMVSHDDGVSWTEKDPDQKAADGIADIIYGEGLFLMITNTGFIYSTTTQETGWTYRCGSLFTYEPNKLAYSGGTFFVTGKKTEDWKGILAYSGSGTSWSSIEYTDSYPVLFAYGSSTYIMYMKKRNFSYYYLVRSTSLPYTINYNYAKTMYTCPVDLTYTSNRFLALESTGLVTASYDKGVSWPQYNGMAGSESLLYRIKFLNSQFFTVGDNGTIRRSSNLADWEEVEGKHFSIKNLSYCNGTFFAGSANKLYTLDQENNWQLHLDSFMQTRMFYIKDTYMSFYPYGSSLRTSADALTWTYQKQQDGAYMKSYLDLAYCNGRIVMTSADRRKVAISDDGITWEEKTVNPYFPYMGAYEQVIGVEENKSFYAIDSNGFSFKSTDGENWLQLRNLPFQMVIKMVYGNGYIVAISNNEITRHPIERDETAGWSAAQEFDNKRFRNITYYNGLFVIVGDNGTILTSPDGATWNDCSLPGFDLYATSGRQQ